MRAWIVLFFPVLTCGKQVLFGDIGVNANSGEENEFNISFVEKDANDKDTTTTTVQTQQAKDEETWLVDHYYQPIYYDQYQSDSPSASDPAPPPDFCPPIPEVVTDEACALSVCHSDGDCQESERCCFNGCMYTCLLEVQPAPVLDWRIEPRRFRSGISWLIDGSQRPSDDAELCSTAPVGPDEDPLLCPHGYFCYVEDAGDQKKQDGGGKQNTRGICVKEPEKGSLEQEVELSLTSSLEGRKFCTVDNIVLLEDAKIRLADKHCRCKKGFLSCAKYKPGAKVPSRKDKNKKRRKNKNKDDSKRKPDDSKKKNKSKKRDDSKRSKRRKRKRNKKKKDDNSTS